MQEYLKIEEFKDYTKKQDFKYKEFHKALEDAKIDWSVDKNKQIAEYRALLTKCEDGLKVVAFNDEMFTAMQEQVKESQRQIWQVDKDIKEVDKRMLQKRVQPIEQRMDHINKEIIAINRVQDERTPQQQRNDMFYGAMKLLSNMEDTSVSSSLVSNAPNYLTDITGAKRRRNSTLGLIKTDQQSNKDSLYANESQKLFNQSKQSEPRPSNRNRVQDAAFNEPFQSRSEGGRF